MELIINPPKEIWESLCERNIPDDVDIEKSVEDIISQIKEWRRSAP